jgi:hypothetical protein
LNVKRNLKPLAVWVDLRIKLTISADYGIMALSEKDRGIDNVRGTVKKREIRNYRASACAGGGVY